MEPATLIVIVAFLMAASLVMLVALLVGNRNRQVRTRLEGLAGRSDASLDKPSTQAVSQALRTTLPKMGKHLMPGNAEEQSRLKTRLLHAGMYHPQTLPIFLGVKMFLMVAPAIVGLAVGLGTQLPTNISVMVGACASIFGMIGPSFWLDNRKKKRKTSLRRGLPDALDLIIICMEGGLSLNAAMQRVASELRTAHPILAFEFKIVQREVQLGSPLGDALRAFAVRTDLDDLRNLAAAIKNAERFGASMVKTLRTFAETVRIRRQQRAEEMAQKAATQILFPTLLFIFPAIFLVILGPAAIQLVEVMGNMQK